MTKVWQMPDGAVRVLHAPEDEEIARVERAGGVEMRPVRPGRPARDFLKALGHSDAHMALAIRAGVRAEDFNVSPGTKRAFEDCFVLYRAYHRAFSDFWTIASAAHTDDR
jgi:hypothetical protein